MKGIWIKVKRQFLPSITDACAIIEGEEMGVTTGEGEEESVAAIKVISKLSIKGSQISPLSLKITEIKR